MKFFLTILLTCVAGTAFADEWRPAKDYLFIAEDCSTDDDAERCRLMKQTWERDYNGAIKGDYQGQRNVAYCLSTGCSDLYGTVLRKNAVLGCAWHIVIVNSGHLDANTTDIAMMKLYCGPHYIDDDARVMANAQARTILKMLGLTAQLQ